MSMIRAPMWTITSLNQLHWHKMLVTNQQQTSNKAYLKYLLNKHNVLRFVSDPKHCVSRMDRRWRSWSSREAASKGGPWVVVINLRCLQNIKKKKKIFENFCPFWFSFQNDNPKRAWIINGSGSCFLSNRKQNYNMTLDEDFNVLCEIEIWDASRESVVSVLARNLNIQPHRLLFFG